MVIVGLMFSSIPVFATQSPESPELPESITKDGKVFTLDKSYGGGPGTATPDKTLDNSMNLLSSYRVTGSDVALYIDYSHGHGGDHYAHGFVEATAPRFTARAEVWENGRLNTAGTNNLNRGNIAYGTSHLAVGVSSAHYPRIFYNW
ncbi:hypothetical protein [Gracilibacillus xinjiangensis]|uniref:Uncharacterized protein n=1 Tax=Gracilibacillus xinjiangensis TaxID=1193282 RepID=A0ABV8WUC6_9BACI